MRFRDRFTNKQYDNIFIDINNTCNCRCPFCYSEFPKISERIFMPEATFRKTLKLLPLVRDKFFFSCSAEATLHPQFIEFLKMAPTQYSKKIVFTTNLSTNISDYMIQELSQLNIHHINISLDSLTPAVYEYLRRGAKFNNFINNLERLAHAFSKNPKAPPLQYITMVFRQNFNEIPYILERCFKEYLSTKNEFRSSFNLPQISDEWKQKNSISDKEWQQVEKSLSKTPYKFFIYRPDKVISEDQPRIFINPEGIVRVYGKRNEQYDINQISSPFNFFKKLRKEL